MKTESIIISGTSGSGKSTIVDRLTENAEFKKVKSITTRSEREDDRENRYEYISDDRFNELKESGKLLIWATYRGEHYGVKKSEYEEIRQSECKPVLVITPESAVQCIIDRENIDETRFLSVFIDAPDEELNKRLTNRDNKDEISEDELNRREKDRTYKENFVYKLENHNLSHTCSAIQTIWKHKDRSGILPRTYIESLIKCDCLIREGSNDDSISHASYDLQLGDEYYQGGNIQTLDVHDPFITIEPYDYAIVMSKETVSFPRNVAGRFDLTVNLFCQGVILSNGPQIDPGFEGRLFCLLFNTSDNKVQLRRGDRYATLEMRKLLSPTDPYEGSYQGKDHIVDYLPEVRMQGAVSQLKDEIDQMKEEREKLQQVVFTRNITIGLGVISFILAMIAIIVAIVTSTGI